ncbi:uncharacterized protein LOC143050786 [Mytilus galloprovincialis]|uniref:uncharacterized protein LOC143050786 n=1 Tax=Mytilus galloprovincialis TaxID=29158 RepID=UPI003F7CAD0D
MSESDILRKHFDYRNRNSSGSVLGSLFSSIEIKTCDAAYPVTFSDLDIKYDVGLAVPFAWFWCDAIVEVVENLYRENKKFNGSRDRIVELLRECVLKFLRDEKNIEHLKKVKSAKSEAEIQAILSHHLFVLLAPSAEYLIDGHHSWPADLKKCPACHEDLNLGNTSIGHHKVWYGFPDIIVNKTTVKVKKDEDESIEDEETQDYEWREPDAKRLKVTNDKQNEMGAGGEGSNLSPDVFTTSIEVKKDEGFANEKNLIQTFAQTITNAFYQSKLNPKLNNLCIPSFLVSNVKLRIMMYNCTQDRLYMSENMALWNKDDSLNVGTVICIWLVLNFENFQNCVSAEDLEAVGLKKSTFQEKLPGDILAIYQDELSRYLPIKKVKKEEQPPKTAFDLPMSKYAQNVLQKLAGMAHRYFT